MATQPAEPPAPASGWGRAAGLQGDRAVAESMGCLVVMRIPPPLHFRPSSLDPRKRPGVAFIIGVDWLEWLLNRRCQTRIAPVSFIGRHNRDAPRSTPGWCPVFALRNSDGLREMASGVRAQRRSLPSPSFPKRSSCPSKHLLQSNQAGRCFAAQPSVGDSRWQLHALSGMHWFTGELRPNPAS